MITSPAFGIQLRIESLLTAKWEEDTSAVFFDERSGETLKLNLVERTAFDCLSSSEVALSFENWVERTALELEVPVDQQLRCYLLSFVEQLEQLGLVHCKHG